MSEEQRRKLQQQLWNIANTLRGKMDGDQFRDYILGFIFYKYLSEKIITFCNQELESDDVLFTEINESTKDGLLMVDALREACVGELGYFLKPSELFHTIAKKGGNRLEQNGTDESYNFPESVN